LKDNKGKIIFLFERDSLSSALAKKAKQDTLICRVDPATFEILK